ncbi:UDP-N-acetylglucosamine 2-epimerase [Homoserinimonas sp. A447]
MFIYGTTAEAIKLAPVARRLEARGIAYESWTTNQHTHALMKIIPELGLNKPSRVIVDGVDGEPLRSSSDAIRWLLRIASWLRKNRSTLRKTLPSNTVIVVHGDTMTSVVGAWIARRLKVECAHVEAGLRSGNWRHPFPEELDRRIVGKLADVHYTPSEEATANLTSRKNVVFTHGNTAIDAVLDQVDDSSDSESPYGVSLLHRFEFLSNRALVEETLATIAVQSPHPVKFFVDAFAKEVLADVLPKADKNKIQIQNKQNHEQFISTLRGAEFIVTDSGGIQAESALLGTPTLIHRKATEQREGLGENILLSEWRSDRLSDFLANYGQYRRSPARPEHSPADIIVEDLVSRGFAK